jgi:hypothetical protein
MSRLYVTCIQQVLSSIMTMIFNMLPACEAIIPGMMPTCVPIPVVTERCGKNAVPLVHYH